MINKTIVESNVQKEHIKEAVQMLIMLNVSYAKLQIAKFVQLLLHAIHANKGLI